MDVLRLFKDYHVQYITDGPNCGPGWINVKCVWCLDPSEHLGWNLEEEFFNCWRCGFHPIISTFARLLNVDESKVSNILKPYGQLTIAPPREPQPRPTVTEQRLPSNIEPLLNSHKQYLINRGFDPEWLERQWHLMSTGPIAKIDDADYKHRIIIPIYWNNRLISFDSRDVTGRAIKRYKACPLEYELTPHKNILYGDQRQWGSTGIVVEGYFDVYRFGGQSCATCGIEYTISQVREIARAFTRVFVVYDDEPQAQTQAKHLVAELQLRGRQAEHIPIVGDPGSMKQSEADYFIKQLMR